MSLKEGCYFGLDDIASDIWRRLEHGLMLEQLLDSLFQDYDAPREVIEEGVVALLHQMAERELIVLS